MNFEAGGKNWIVCDFDTVWCFKVESLKFILSKLMI